MRKFSAWVILFLLLVVPFYNWRLGAAFWMCAFLVYIFQQLFSGNPFKIRRSDADEEKNKDEGKPWERRK
jgi:hypothetical protein